MALNWVPIYNILLALINCEENFVYTDNFVTKRAKKFNGAGRYVHIGQESHPTTDVFSLASQAPYLAA